MKEAKKSGPSITEKRQEILEAPLPLYYWIMTPFSKLSNEILIKY